MPHNLFHFMSFFQTHRRFILVCFSFHLLYLYSIFDIYFRSPLSQSIPEQQKKSTTSDHIGNNNDDKQLSKRVFVFIGDGLRADKAFIPSFAPYLNSLCHNPSSDDHSGLTTDSKPFNSICGVSHTRVPTESRPGHLAVFAGFYEDVSAVLTGWKANTTPFDHVFSRARYAWAIGVPEIVTLFQDTYKNDNKRQVDWNNERRDEPIDPDSSPISILHYSSHQTDFGAKDARTLDQWSLDRLDELLQSTNQEVQRRLHQDQLIVFIHLIGLDVNGHAHGPHSLEYHRNIQFVDAGIQRAVTNIQEYYKDDRTTFLFTSDHGMSDAGTHGDGHPTCTQTPFIVWGAGINENYGKNRDSTKTAIDQNIHLMNIEQASITPLISSLLGIHIPVHSVGVLTKNIIDSLNTTPDHKRNILLSNHDQLLAAYKALEHEWKSKEGSLLFRPYQLSTSEGIYERIDSILEGARYYHKYDWKLMRGIVTIGYITWSIYCLIHKQNIINTPASKLLRSINYTFASFLTLYLFYRQSEWRLFLYTAFPLFFIDRIFARLGPFSSFNADPTSILLTFLGLEAIVQTYYHRWALGVAFLILGLLRHNCSYLFISIFPILPLVQSINQGFLLTSCLTASLLIFHSSPFHSFMTLVCTALSMHSDHMLFTKQGLSPFNQLASWIILITSIISAIRVSMNFKGISNERSSHLTMQVAIRLLPAMILLSVSYEPLFLLSLAYSITSLQSHSTSSLESAITLLLLLTASFFGLGNIASFAHFSLPSAFRFVTVFSPFTMTALLLLKIILPLSLLSTYKNDHYDVKIVIEKGNNHYNVKTLILSLCDYITLRHFYSVTDTGSWLDIGASISRFIIAGALVVLITLLLR